MGKKFKFIDLFSGVGGFRIPLEKLGGHCIGYSEIDEKSIAVYKKNFSLNNEENFGDIAKMKKLPSVDLLTGGVPCQAWSVAGKKKGFDDPRGKLWSDCIRLIKINKPKAFIFENVKGLYDSRNKESLELILNEFKKCGYDVFHKLINAYDFGLPQNRDRLFIIGIQKKNKADFYFPTPVKEVTPLYKIFDDIEFKENFTKKKFIPRDLFGERIPASRNRFQLDDELNDFFIFCDTRNGHSTIHSWELIKTSEREKKICLIILKNRRRKIYGLWDGNPLSLRTLKKLIPGLQKSEIDRLIKKGILYQEENGKYELSHTKNSAGIFGVYRVFLLQSKIFSTITATENRDFIATRTIIANNPENYKKKFINKIYLKRKFRLITGREAARLQGFPDKFKIHENDKTAKKQFGNAVPTNVVYHLAKNIISLNIF